MPFDAAPVTNPVIQDLREARERIERGWCQNQGVYVDPLTHRFSFCTLGAIPSTGLPRVVPLLIRALSARDSHDIAVWNDSPERTQADVLALYDRAIELAVEEVINAA